MNKNLLLGLLIFVSLLASLSGITMFATGLGDDNRVLIGIGLLLYTIGFVVPPTVLSMIEKK